MRGVQLSIGVISILLAWELVVRILNLNQVILPAPSQILLISYENLGFFLQHTVVTTIEIITGFVVGIFFGFFTGLGVYYVPFLRRGMYPILTAMNQIPKISFAPLLLTIFGAGLTTNAIITMFIVFFPMLVNTFAGLDEADDRLLEMTRLYGVSELFVLRKIRLPSALPLIFAAMKLGTTLAVVGAVVAEYVAASEGLGFVLITESAQLRTPMVYAAILYITIVAIVLYVIVLFVEQRVLFWYDEE